MRDHLGLFDTVPSRSEALVASAIIGLVIVTTLAVIPVHRTYIGSIPGLIPALDVGMFLSDLITAAILYSQATVFRSRALTVLASGYLVSGLLLIVWALTFPGAFSANGLLGAKVNTTAWIASFWRLSVPVAIFIYAWLTRVDHTEKLPTTERPPSISRSLLVSFAIAVFVTLLTTVGHDLLPAFFANRSEVIRPTLIAQNLVVITWTVAAIAMLFRRQRSVLDLWLLVALSAWLAQSLLNMLLQSRFSLGALFFLGLTLVSNFSVMLALLTDSNRLYARLALSSAARNREREARLMTLDAVGATIAHEVGQPLAAAKLSSAAALEWLTGPKPDTNKAVESIRGVLDSHERAADVIRSIRSSFSEEKGALTAVDLNDLIRDTLHLMDRELAARKIALELSLQDELPKVSANKVQIQRLLLNLLTNSIEALAMAKRSAPKIAVRAAIQDNKTVLLEVSDNGVGITSEEMKTIFEPFYTSKTTGTGLGLSLCSTIAEAHGGRLWATSSVGGGATFHLQLPRQKVGRLRLDKTADSVGPRQSTCAA